MLNPELKALKIKTTVISIIRINVLKSLYTIGILKKRTWSQFYMKLTCCKVDDGIKHPLKYLLSFRYN